MNIDFAKTIITLIIALIPLASLFIKNRINKSAIQLENPSIKVLDIIREPVDKKYINRIRILNMIDSYLKLIPFLLLCGFILVFIAWILPIGHRENMSIFLTVYSIFYILVGWSSIKQMKSPYNIRNSYDLRYFVFDSIYISIEADYHYIFNKCHETLRKLDFKNIEISEINGTLEACQVKILTIVKISIKLYKLYKSDKSYSIDIVYKCDKSTSSNSMYINKLITKRHFDTKNIIDKSKFINKFVYELISKKADVAQDNKQ